MARRTDFSNSFLNPIDGRNRFAFGENWQKYLSKLTPARVAAARRSLAKLLDREDLSGVRFLDVGSGSGLFSLAAFDLGATVTSFDFDAKSVECARRLSEMRSASEERWQIVRGSVLDQGFVQHLARFDVVYAWGVLHHTGSMWTAMANVTSCVEPGGKLILAIYNDQGWISKFWWVVKRTYNRIPVSRIFIIALFAPYLYLGRYVIRAITGRLAEERGMDLWNDMIDWLGGYPFETTKPEEIDSFFEQYGFSCVKSKLVGRRHGCNEFVMLRSLNV